MASVAVAGLTITTMAGTGAALAAGEERTARHVQVIAAGSAEDVAALTTTLRELLGRLGVSVSVERATPARASAPGREPVPSGEARFAVVGVDLASSGALVVVDDESGKERMRRALPPSIDRAAAVEEAAHVVQAAVEALTEGAEQEARRDSPEGGSAAAASSPLRDPVSPVSPVPPSPTSAPPLSTPPVVTPPAVTRDPRSATSDDAARAPAAHRPSAQSPWPPASLPRYGVSVLAGFDTTVDSGTTTVAVGAEAGAIFRRTCADSWFAPSLWVIGDYHAPFRSTRDDVALDVTTASARILPTLRLAHGDSWSIEGGAGAGFDVVLARPGTTEPLAATVVSTRSDVDPILTAMVAAHTAIASSAALFVAARLDVDVGTERYDAAGPTGRVTVFDPWTFRPELLVGFTLGLLGAPDYPAKKVLP